MAGKDPVAAARLAAVREALTAMAAEHELPVENLLTPDYVRRLAWRPPTPRPRRRSMRPSACGRRAAGQQRRTDAWR